MGVAVLWHRGHILCNNVGVDAVGSKPTKSTPSHQPRRAGVHWPSFGWQCIEEKGTSIEWVNLLYFALKPYSWVFQYKHIWYSAATYVMWCANIVEKKYFYFLVRKNWSAEMRSWVSKNIFVLEYRCIDYIKVVYSILVDLEFVFLSPRIDASSRTWADVSFSVRSLQSTPPYGKMLTSIPFWALIVLHYGSLWGLFFLLTAAPEFMKNVLLFDLTNSGFMASLPHLARFLAGFAFGYIGDKIRQHQWMTPIAVRKVFSIFCKFGNGWCANAIVQSSRLL